VASDCAPKSVYEGSLFVSAKGELPLHFIFLTCLVSSSYIFSRSFVKSQKRHLSTLTYLNYSLHLQSDKFGLVAILLGAFEEKNIDLPYSELRV
jgi:hypothetical protein